MRYSTYTADKHCLENKTVGYITRPDAATCSQPRIVPQPVTTGLWCSCASGLIEGLINEIACSALDKAKLSG